MMVVKLLELVITMYVLYYKKMRCAVVDRQKPAIQMEVFVLVFPCILMFNLIWF